jgi:signal peptidase I
MNKLKTPPRTTETKASHDVATAPQGAGHTMRETVESIVIAFVLAFLFRTFEAEAFVIPTGSMAPTLQGRHKDLPCDKCGYRIRASASSEAEEGGLFAQEGGDRRRQEVVAVTCPMCRHIMPIDPKDPEDRSYNGDRILVGKFPYDFVEPQRWDIVVFKYPGDAKTNYIKRLVGLPGETVHIEHGDIFTKHEDSALEIQRKPPAKQRAMAQIVYDNDYIVEDMTKKGWPLRWQNWPAANDQTAKGWTSDDEGKSFSILGSDQESWIRYQHFIPSIEDWNILRAGSLPRDFIVKPALITDFYAYNNSIVRGQVRERRRPDGLPGSIVEIDPDTSSLGLHWVGDLLLETTVDVQSKTGELHFDLVEGGKHFRATLDVATGEAKLTIDGLADFTPQAKTSLSGEGTYRVVFANFDDELRLWINGSLVEFDKPTTYAPLGNTTPKSSPEDPGDLAPAGVGASGGLALKVSHLRLLRDIYYIADRTNENVRGAITDFEYPATNVPFWGRNRFREFISSPDEWKTTVKGSRVLIVRDNDNDPNTPPAEKELPRGPFDFRRFVEFKLEKFASEPEKDQFFVLGDNSPASKDSRLWDDEHYVARELMIGKALFIYWPHSFDRIPGTSIPCPYFPNFGDMGFVR